MVPELLKVIIDKSPASEHVAEVKHRIRVIKEWCRANLIAMPFKSIPNIMTINLVHFYVFWLNATPVKSSTKMVQVHVWGLC